MRPSYKRQNKERNSLLNFLSVELKKRNVSVYKSRLDLTTFQYDVIHVRETPEKYNPFPGGNSASI